MAVRNIRCTLKRHEEEEEAHIIIIIIVINNKFRVFLRVATGRVGILRKHRDAVNMQQSS